MSTLKTRVGITFHTELTGPTDLGTPLDTLNLDVAVLLRNGVASGQASKLWYDGARSIAPSGTDDLDLSGTLVNRFNEAVVFTAVKAVFIRADRANVNNVVVGAAAANPWTAVLNATGTLTLRPGAVNSLVADQASNTGYPVVAGTGDILRVANSAAGTAVLYDIAIVGI